MAAKQPFTDRHVCENESPVLPPGRERGYFCFSRARAIRADRTTGGRRGRVNTRRHESPRVGKGRGRALTAEHRLDRRRDTSTGSHRPAGNSAVLAHRRTAHGAPPLAHHREKEKALPPPPKPSFFSSTITYPCPLPPSPTRRRR